MAIVIPPSVALVSRAHTIFYMGETTHEPMLPFPATQARRRRSVAEVHGNRISSIGKPTSVCSSVTFTSVAARFRSPLAVERIRYLTLLLLMAPNEALQRMSHRHR
jgi:hypothetical protein